MTEKMPFNLWCGDITEGSNNTLVQIEKRHDHFHTEYINLSQLRDMLAEMKRKPPHLCDVLSGVHPNNAKEIQAYNQALKDLLEKLTNI